MNDISIFTAMRKILNDAAKKGLVYKNFEYKKTKLDDLDIFLKKHETLNKLKKRIKADK